MKTPSALLLTLSLTALSLCHVRAENAVSAHKNAVLVKKVAPAPRSAKPIAKSPTIFKKSPILEKPKVAVLNLGEKMKQGAKSLVPKRPQPAKPIEKKANVQKVKKIEVTPVVTSKPKPPVEVSKVVKKAIPIKAVAKQTKVKTDPVKNHKTEPQKASANQVSAVKAPKPLTEPTMSVESVAPEASLSNVPVVQRAKSVQVTGGETYMSVAKHYGTTVERLNELNGIILPGSTVLAKGSELLVPTTE